MNNSELEENLSYFHKDAFNGVLIILREPNGGALKENKKWIKCVLTGAFKEDYPHPKTKRQITKYHNRFEEILNLICVNPDLSRIAYTNIKQIGGGSNISKAYRNMTIETEGEILKAIIEYINPKYVFTVNDIYNAARYIFNNSKDYCICKEDDNNAIYKNKTKRKMIIKNNISTIEFYEIIHPCVSPRIGTNI